MGIKKLKTSTSAESQHDWSPTRPPTIITPLMLTTTKWVDQSIELVCLVEGHPYPTIDWYFNGNIVTTSDRLKLTNEQQKLHIRRLTYDDAGIYKCVVHNIAGEAESFCELNIKANPAIRRPAIVEEPQDMIAYCGDVVKISSKVLSPAMGVNAFSWLKCDQWIKENDHYRYNETNLNKDTKIISLEILNVTQDDNGDYGCHVLGLFGGVHSKKANLVVL